MSAARILARAGFYNPPDVDEQHRIWKATCGPAALAALLGKTVAEIRPIVEQAQGGSFLGFMNAGHLKAALAVAKVRHERRDTAMRGEIAWPFQTGLAVLQIDGPWCEQGVPPKARFRYTHIIAAAVEGAVIYDANARCWLTRQIWEREVMADIVRETKRAAGWYTSTVIEVLTP